MRAGEYVKLIGIPADARDQGDVPTRSLFEKCLGKTFVVSAVETVEGFDRRLARLEVGHLIGKAPNMEVIWVEERYLELQEQR